PRGRVVLGPRPPSGSVADQASGGPPSDDSRRLRQFHYDCAQTFSQTENLTGTIDQLYSVPQVAAYLPGRVHRAQRCSIYCTPNTGWLQPGRSNSAVKRRSSTRKFRNRSRAISMPITRLAFLWLQISNLQGRIC